MNPQSRDILLINPQRLDADFRQGLSGLGRDQIVGRIWGRDWTVWKPEDREISNRLGWLEAPEDAVESIPELEVFAGSRTLPER